MQDSSVLITKWHYRKGGHELVYHQFICLGK